jgi:FtsZ-interacting cell division protein ZipA
VIGIIIGSLLIVGLLFMCLMKRRRREQSQSIPQLGHTEAKALDNLPEMGDAPVTAIETNVHHGLPEMEGEEKAAADFTAAANAPIPISLEKQKLTARSPSNASNAPILIRTNSAHAPIPVSPELTAPPASDSNLESIHEEYARVQQRKSRLQELMRLEEEEERLRRQIQGTQLQAPLPPAEFPSGDAP